VSSGSDLHENPDDLTVDIVRALKLATATL
jgi:hypothetical protein